MQIERQVNDMKKLKTRDENIIHFLQLRAANG